MLAHRPATSGSGKVKRPGSRRRPGRFSRLPPRACRGHWRRFHRCQPAGCYNLRMDNDELTERVVALRSQGKSTNAIARELDVPRGQIAPIVRAAANTHRNEAPAADVGLVGCWISAGWSAGLTVYDHTGPRWPDRRVRAGEASGLVGVLVARRRSTASANVSLCGYLVDTYCLGVKDALGPQVVRTHDLVRAVDRFFAAFDGPPLDAPLDLARHLVWGAVDYARQLGFEPHRDFAQASGHLQPLDRPAVIAFGCHGMPYYIQGPHDEPDAIMRTLHNNVGDNGYHYTVAISIGAG